MKWLNRLLITTLMCTGIAVALSLLPQLENGWDSPVINSVRAQSISETNIVDVISKMQLHLRIRKVELSHAIVSVDLFASPSSDRNEIIQDLFELPDTLFGRSTNINQVLVRVLDSSQNTGGSGSLLLAADARREKWLSSESGLSIRSADEKEQYLQSHFNMTYTSNWRERRSLKN